MARHALSLMALLASTRVTMVAAREEIASVLLPNADQFFYGVMGSIVSSNTNGTAIELGCPPHSSTDNCQYMFGDTVTYGPTTFSVNVPLYTRTGPSPGSKQVWSSNLACSMDTAADIAYCTEEYASGRPQEVQVYHHKTAQESYSGLRTPVTITAGFEKLEASPGSSHETSVPSETAASSGSSSTDESTRGYENTSSQTIAPPSNSVAGTTTQDSTTTGTTTSGAAHGAGSSIVTAAVAMVVCWGLVT